MAAVAALVLATVALVRWVDENRASPDGRRPVYAAVTPGGTSIRVRSQDGSELETAERGFWPRWSPDGSYLARSGSQRPEDVEGGGMWVCEAAAGSPQLVRALDSEMEDLYLEGLDIGRGGAPILFILATYTGELYVMEPPG
jgi:hypothetical protein